MIETGIIKRIEEIITVADVPFKRILVNDRWFSCFHTSINNSLKIGSKISFDYDVTKDGKFFHISKLYDNILPSVDERIDVLEKKIKELKDLLHYHINDEWGHNI